jgi:signal transduction histidine kinase
LALRLGLLRHGVQPGGQTSQDHIGELQDELHGVLDDLRDMADKIYPPLLDRAGLGPALREMAAHVETPVAVAVSGGRFGPAAEGAAYFAVAACLASLPAGAPAMEVVVRREGGQLMLSISGAGAGHAELMSNQAHPLGGTVDVADQDRPGANTITARIPCE